MARLARKPSPGKDDQDNSSTLSRATRQRPSRSSVNPGSLSPSPAASFSSDKENRITSGNPSLRASGKSKAMPPPRLPTPTSAEPDTPHASKRRRLVECDAPNASQVAYQRELREINDTTYYDPDQPMEERRAVRKGIRDLARGLTDSKSEYMTAESTGLVDTLNKANDIFANVKQTSDATLDSRLLVSTGDISARRSLQLKLGDSTQGIDVDEFVSRCISFMRKGPNDSEATLSGASTQRRRRRRDEDEEDDSVGEGSADEGDAYNWEWLGRKACFPNNIRPPVPGFLLGPLSVQKRIRRQTQRRERLQKRDPRDAVRPEELKTADFEKAENSNLTAVCTKLRETLNKVQVEGQAGVEKDASDDMSESELRAIMAKHHVMDDGGLPFFHVVINPQSFGQSVENLFYISFLIRDGVLGVGKDSKALPTLHLTQPRTAQEIEEEGITNSKYQVVFHLDFPTWENIVDAFEIKSCIIPHRRSDMVPVSATGWYA